MHFDILFIVSSGIGNVVEMLYSVEYAMERSGLKVGLYVEKVPNSFLQFLKESYGDIILDQINGISTKYLIHSLTVEKHVDIPFEHYFYIKPDRYSSSYLSETEQAISIVSALYPNGQVAPTLKYLQIKAPKGISLEFISHKTIIYPGCASINPVKRWPYFKDLIEKLNKENVMVVGGKDDLNFSSSFIFPRWFTSWAPQSVLNKKSVWQLFKSIGLLIKYSHWPEMEHLSYVFIEKYSWAELVWIFRNGKEFIGNDGGLTHLAAASGAKGIVFFGPTSMGKNRPLNPNIRPIFHATTCSPCQFAVGGIQMTKGYINCPFQVKCLSGIKTETVLSMLIKK
jgi:hypothetical protein